MANRSSRRHIAALSFVALVVVSAGCDTRAPSKASAGGPAASVAASAAPKEAAATQVRFLRHTPVKGQVIVEESSMNMTTSTTVKKGEKLVSEGTVAKGETEKTKTTILAADETTVSGVRCEYLEKAFTESAGGGAETKKNAVVSGKTYLVTLKNGKIDVMNATRRAVFKKEREEVQKDHADLGKPSQTAQLFPDRPILLGETLTPSASVIREMMRAGDDSMELRDVSLTFKAVEGSGSARAAVFDMSMRVTSSNKKGSPPVEMALAGSLKVLVDGTLPLELGLSGPVSMETSEKGTSTSVKGQARFSVKTTY